MRDVIEIQPEWLVELAPHYYKGLDIIDPKDHHKKYLKNKGTSKMTD